MILSILTLFCVFMTSLLLISIVLFKLPKPENENNFKKTDQRASRKTVTQSNGGRSKFVQTLSATFAQLMVGIAVFDKNNELSLFNPALSQHLGLRPEWLLQQPNLLSFMDRLRDTQVLPEPKNYTSWRQTFRQIERSAMRDDFREDWDLPDGRTLRVIGRPHPSGTVVFLFEDVTNALVMERGFRSKIHKLQSAMNATSIGIIVFDRTGATTFQNHAFKEEVINARDCKTTHDFSNLMQSIFHPTPTWGDLREYVENTQDRTPWYADIKTHNGDPVIVNFEPMPTGDTLCEFHTYTKINNTENVSLACEA
ncbi:hypothetical protein F9L33_08270 [Amylibacter sp. SFDW26]|uniref:PAS-domain containing protein n=1 Tax=Amylibacter sp. SFDW26 TaxID=2652722 RepID=UPI001261A6C6|nr:PAS-domain containing protein [Amylibacter sp. SFDW26]KAB7614622.1 hypothetical protein F9L33_08270 [Amylibacter sp. SFDW26]